MRVAFLFAHLHKGGMQQAVSNISRALPASIEQFVVYFGTERPSFSYNAKLVDLGVPGRVEYGWSRKVVNFIRRVRRLRRFVREERIDAVVSFGEAANVLNCVVRSKRRILAVRSALAESLRHEGSIGFLYTRMAKFLYKRADRVVAVTAAIGNELAAEFNVPRAKIAIVPNLYHADEIRQRASEALPAALAPIFEQPVVINVGSLIDLKAHDLLLGSYAIAKREEPRLQLVLVGEGPRRQPLAELARDLGVADSVHFAGFDPNPFRYMARATIYALTSRFEGFPNALVEAMILGVPVISVDCPTGPREILGESEFGILVGRDQVEIARAIVRLLDPGEHARFRAKALERAREFDRDRVVDRWLEVLR